MDDMPHTPDKTRIQDADTEKLDIKRPERFSASLELVPPAQHPHYFSLITPCLVWFISLPCIFNDLFLADTLSTPAISYATYVTSVLPIQTMAITSTFLRIQMAFGDAVHGQVLGFDILVPFVFGKPFLVGPSLIYHPPIQQYISFTTRHGYPH